MRKSDKRSCTQRYHGGGEPETALGRTAAVQPEPSVDSEA
jgi:hypothetical protein